MLELTGSGSRSSFVAAASALSLLAAAAGATYGALGAEAATTVVAAGGVLLSVAALLVTNRRLRRADDRRRLGERALEAVPTPYSSWMRCNRGGPIGTWIRLMLSSRGTASRKPSATASMALTIFADPPTVTALDRRLGAAATSRVSVRRRDGSTVAAELELHAVPRNNGGRYLVGLLGKFGTNERLNDRPQEPKLEPVRASAEPTGRAKDAFLSSLSQELLVRRSTLASCGSTCWRSPPARQAHEGSRGHQAQPRSADPPRQRLERREQISSGGLEVRLGPLDVVALLNSNFDTWQLLAIGKQLSLHHRIEPESANVNADSERLLQALNHLVENAVTSTPAGGRIDIRVRCDCGVCIVEIEDTGMALSAKDAANLFVPFWRAPDSAKARPGIGLGLAVAHDLIAKHRGTLTATSDGPSTRFTLTLPLLAASDSETDLPASGNRRLEL